MFSEKVVFAPAHLILNTLLVIFDARLSTDIERLALSIIALLFWLYVIKAIIAIIKKLFGFHPQERQR